jgi:anti-anti-sigma factor
MVRTNEWDTSRRLVRSSAARQWWTTRPETAPALELEVASGGGRTVVVVRGDVDAVTAPRLEAALLGLPLAGTTTLELELSEVGLLGSVGLSVLLVASRRCQQAGVEMVLCHVRDSVWRVVEVAGLHRVFATQPPRGPRPAPQELALF